MFLRLHEYNEHNCKYKGVEEILINVDRINYIRNHEGDTVISCEDEPWIHVTESMEIIKKMLTFGKANNIIACDDTGKYISVSDKTYENGTTRMCGYLADN